MPLNIDFQQILLHLLNFVILAGGLYFLLYRPVKSFMDKREAYYQSLDREAREKSAQAEQMRADIQARLDALDEEIRQKKNEAQQDLRRSIQAQLDESHRQAEQILADAQAAAQTEHDKMLLSVRQELAGLAAETAEKMLHQAEGDLYDQFLNMAEGGTAHEQP